MAIDPLVRVLLACSVVLISLFVILAIRYSGPLFPTEIPTSYTMPWASFLPVAPLLMIVVMWFAYFSFKVLAATGLPKASPQVTMVVLSVIAIGMIIRFVYFPHISGDYWHFIRQWVNEIRLNGIQGVITSGADYNMSYMYIMWVIARLPVADLGLVKLVSVVGDVLLALGAMSLASHLAKDDRYRKLISIVTLGLVWLLPTVVMNSSWWGQTDAIYTGFVVWSLYFALQRRPHLAVIMVSVAFAFKLQTVFFLPVGAVLLFCGLLKVRHLLWFPLVNIVISLPAIIRGIPFEHVFGVYINQAGLRAHSLTNNAPSVWGLFTWETLHADAQRVSMLRTLSISSAFAFLVLMLLVAWIHRKRMSDSTVLVFSVLITLGTPFLLPQMHDRYFFTAEIFAVVLAVTAISRFKAPIYVLPLMVTAASLFAYQNYLRLAGFPVGEPVTVLPGFQGVPMVYGAVLNLMALIFSAYLLWKSIQADRASEHPAPVLIA